MKINSKKLVIIDGNAVIYRSFYAIRQELTSNGQPTNAVYGFFSILFKVIKELSPDYLLVALDRPEPTFRHQLSSEYKAQRTKQPDELYVQIPIIKEILAAFKVPVLEKIGYEADDIIGTVVNQLSDNLKSYIVTGDKDSFQLVNQRVSVYWLKQGLQKTVIVNPDDVQVLTGLTSDQMVDYKALRGDPSDNILGVPGIGDKTAVSLLQKFGNLDKIQELVASQQENINIKPRWRELIAKHQKELDLSQQLAQIDCQVPISFSLDEARWGDLDLVVARQALIDWQLLSLVGRLERLFLTKTDNLNNSTTGKSVKTPLIITQPTTSQITNLSQQAKSLSIVPVIVDNQITALFIADSQQSQVYHLVIKNTDQGALFEEPSLKKTTDLEAWRIVLENQTVNKTIFQAKKVVKFLQNQNIQLRGLIGDPLVANYLLQPGSRQDSLLTIVQQAGLFLLSQTDDQVNLAVVTAQLTHVHDFLEQQLVNQQLLKIYQEIEIPLILVLAKMELIGIKVDQGKLVELAKQWQGELDQLTKKIYQQAGQEFNINSPKQLQEILFNKLGLSSKGLSRTKSGPSTDASNLQKLTTAHPIAILLLEYREIAKLLSTYALSLPRLISSSDSRIRANFHQTVTSTGRLSSSEPNLQNIPIRTVMGRKLRQAFVAEKGYQLISFDYSQVELRIMASLAKETNMIIDFLDKKDIHLATAAKINNLSIDQVTDEQRRTAKAVNFGILYGQGPHGLSEVTGLSYREAKDFIDQYFTVYPQIASYVQQLIERATKNGYAETVWGRRRYLPELTNDHQGLRRAGERMAVNLPIQGTAADITKAAMIKVDQWLTANFLPDQVRLVLQIHDEIIIEAESALITQISQPIAQLMTEVIDLEVPLVVNLTTGNNWSEL